MRRWDLARAANAEKVGFWGDIADYVFIFRFGGGARARGRAGQVEGSAGGGVAVVVLATWGLASVVAGMGWPHSGQRSVEARRS